MNQREIDELTDQLIEQLGAVPSDERRAELLHRVVERLFQVIAGVSIKLKLGDSDSS
jgi:hypothetical protein